MVTINRNNIQDYIDYGIIDPTKVKIDLNKNKTTSDNTHHWVTLQEAIDSGYDFNFDYDDKKLVKKPVKEETLPEVEVTATKNKPKSAFEDTLSQITSILGTNRVKNMQKASPEVMDNWKVAENALEGINYASGGFLNRLSPTQNIGFIVDAVKGKNLVNSWFGNSGITSEEFSQKYPYLAMAINTVGDVGIGYGFNKFHKWGTTPKHIGSGAEFDVETAPWWTYVKKTGDIPPNEVQLKNSVAGMVPMKYVGQTPEGLYQYTQKKVIVPKKLPKSMIKLYQHLVDNQWFPNRQETNLDFISPVRKLALLDVDTGNVGYKNWFDYLLQRRPVIIDNAVLEIPDYFALYEKKGGKLIPKAKSGIKLIKKFKFGGNYVDKSTGQTFSEMPEGYTTLNSYETDKYKSTHTHTLPEVVVIGKRPDELSWWKKLIYSLKGTPTYNDLNKWPDLKSAIYQAWHDSDENIDNTIIYNNRAYKASLNPEDQLEYVNKFGNYDRLSVKERNLPKDYYYTNITEDIISRGYDPELADPIYDSEQLAYIRKALANKELSPENTIDMQGGMYDVYNDPIRYLYNMSRRLQLNKLKSINDYEYPMQELQDPSNVLLLDINNNNIQKKIPKHVIQQLVQNLNSENDIWIGLGIATKETRFGQGSGTDYLPENQGYIRRIFNNHGYENDNPFMNVIGYAYRKAVGKNVGWKQIQQVLGNPYKLKETNPEIYEQMSKIIRADLPYNYENWINNIDTTNFYQDAINRFNSGKYNPKESNYNASVMGFVSELKKSKVLQEYINKLINEK